MQSSQRVTGDWFAPSWSGAWKSLAVLGLNFVLLAVLIFLFPALLAYLIAAFLLVDGALLLLGAYWCRRQERVIRRQHSWREPLDPIVWN